MGRIILGSEVVFVRSLGSFIAGEGGEGCARFDAKRAGTFSNELARLNFSGVVLTAGATEGGGGGVNANLRPYKYY